MLLLIIDLAKESLRNLTCFILIIKYLLLTKKVSYDLILAIGDSGVYMASVVKVVYLFLNIEYPPVIKLPIYRYKSKKMYHSINQSDLFDNSILENKILSSLKKYRTLKHILIPDDEVGLGTSIKAALKLIYQNSKYKVSTTIIPDIDIVAEDHEFDLRNLKDNYNVSLYSFGCQTPGIYHKITYHLPLQISNSIRQIFSVRKLGDKQLMSLLMNQPTKHKRRGAPVIDNSLNIEIKSKIPKFSSYRRLYLNFLKQQIRTSLQNKEFSSSDINKVTINHKVLAWKLLDPINDRKK